MTISLDDLSLERIKEQIPEGWRNICEYAFLGCEDSKEKYKFGVSCVNGGYNCILKFYRGGLLISTFDRLGIL